MNGEFISDEARALIDDFMIPSEPARMDNHEWLEGLRDAAHVEFFALADGLDIDWRYKDIDLGGVPCKELIVGDEEQAKTKVLLHFHGGCYCFLKPETSTAFTAPLAAAANRRLVSVDYRLAPEAPFPAGLNDALSAYEALLAEGADPDDIAFVGESAGGGMALALALKLRDEYKPMPGSLLLVCPWLDLTGSGESYDSVQPHDPFLTWEKDMEEQARVYAGERDPAEPLISPIFAKDFGGLPRTLVQVGSREILLSDATICARKMRNDGVPVSLEVYEGMIHVWHMFHHLPEAREAVTSLVKYLDG